MFDIIDITKIVITVVSIVALILFRKKIINYLQNVVNYPREGKLDSMGNSDIIDDVDMMMGEVLK